MAGRHDEPPTSDGRPSVRERILDAAVELLRSGGLKRLGQTQVAKSAGVPQGHLTYYFPRKHDLMIAVARRSVELIGGVLASAMAKGRLTPEGRARLAPLVTAVVRDRERTRMLLGLLVEADESDELRRLLLEATGTTRRLLSEALQIPEDGPLATGALALLWGLGLWAFLVDDPVRDGIDELVHRLEAFVDLLTEGREG